VCESSQPPLAETRFQIPFNAAKKTGSKVLTGMHRNDRLALPAAHDDVRAALP